jgi:hypothetical protein
MTRPLLTPDEYRRIVEEGRAAEVLARYVKRLPGRVPSGDALTAAEKQRAYRERLATERKKPAKGSKGKR